MSEELKEKRSNKRFTQSDMAKLLECSETYYSLLETGKMTPSVAMAKKIERLLGVEWTIFFKEKIN
ncbi:helix-turn-helix transcriptional regulator [Salinicoccus roseus]|uniref:helix-turn-helix transcriptional regulator n=1 Tax=Salinicoccus roseus TaxID=45670 RepID=UPI0023015570|nr:helix-turn-helix transcriptional regulator [Salinicoccus roseus]